MAGAALWRPPSSFCEVGAALWTCRVGCFLRITGSGLRHLATTRKFLAGVGHGESVVLHVKGSIWWRCVWDVILRCRRGFGHFTLHTLHSTLYSLHFTFHTCHSPLHTLHSTLLTCLTLHLALYTPHPTLYTLHCTRQTLHSTLYTLHSTLHPLHSTLYTLHFTHCTVNPSLYTLHSTLCTLHFRAWTLYT